MRWRGDASIGSMSFIVPAAGVRYTAMVGTKIRNFAPLPDLSHEELVPKDNFYRRLEALFDLSFVRYLVSDCYACSGRPSVDPVVFFGLQLVMFFEDIRSERRLMEVAVDRLSVRQGFLGCDLHEPLPGHSSLSRIRERHGFEIFRRFFERIAKEYFEAGLVWGEELCFDYTKVEANADVEPPLAIHSSESPQRALRGDRQPTDRGRRHGASES